METAHVTDRRRFWTEYQPGFRFTDAPLMYSNGVIHHLPDTAEAVREFDRVLRPAGTGLGERLARRWGRQLWVHATNQQS
jgi:hypothetical protein